jgi:hypothetical protein
MLGRPDHRDPDPEGRQVIHIEVDGGYRPAVVRARPGSAIRLIFHRIDDDDCTERVIFSTPRLERRLAAYGSTPVDLLAQEEGEIRFTCGMGRYSGVIRLEEPSPSWLGALRRRVDHIRGALAVSIIVAAVGLPIVAVLALVGIGATAALIAGGLALVSVGPWGVGKLRHRQHHAGGGQLLDEAVPVVSGPSRPHSGRT